MIGKKKSKVNNDGTCVWIDSVGSIKLRIFKIIEQKDKNVKIDFGNDEVYIIRKDNIRGKRVMIYQTADEKIHVQNPNNWKNLDLKKYGIQELKFNLQNFAIQEGRASIHRWTLPKDRISQLLPYFKFMIIAITVGVMAWGAMKFGIYVFEVVMNSRTLDCASILPKVQVPLGAVIPNATVPLGV